MSHGRRSAALCRALFYVTPPQQGPAHPSRAFLHAPGKGVPWSEGPHGIGHATVAVKRQFARPSHGWPIFANPKGRIAVLADDELTRVAEIAAARVDREGTADRHGPECHVDHVTIARTGIEEGLKLAARLLREQSERPITSTSDRTPPASGGSRCNP